MNKILNEGLFVHVHAIAFCDFSTTGSEHNFKQMQVCTGTCTYFVYFAIVQQMDMNTILNKCKCVQVHVHTLCILRLFT